MGGVKSTGTGAPPTPLPPPFLDARRGGRENPAGGKIGLQVGFLREAGGGVEWLADPAGWEGVGVVSSDLACVCAWEHRTRLWDEGPPRPWGAACLLGQLV